MPARKKTPVTPRRVLNKIAECHYFLQRMDQHEEHPAEFGYCLSPFLSALRSVEWLAPMADSKDRKQISNSIEQLKTARPDLNYLLNERDAEVRREGVKIVMTLAGSIRPVQCGFTFPSGRFSGRFEGRFQRPRFQAPWTQEVYKPVYGYRWRSQDYPARDVVQVCRDSLNALEQLVTG